MIDLTDVTSVWEMPRVAVAINLSGKFVIHTDFESEKNLGKSESRKNDNTRLIQKVNTVSLLKNRVRFLIKFYCYQILHSSNYFSTYTPPLLKNLS